MSNISYNDHMNRPGCVFWSMLAAAATVAVGLTFGLAFPAEAAPIKTADGLYASETMDAITWEKSSLELSAHVGGEYGSCLDFVSAVTSYGKMFKALGKVPVDPAIGVTLPVRAGDVLYSANLDADGNWVSSHVDIVERVESTCDYFGDGECLPVVTLIYDAPSIRVERDMWDVGGQAKRQVIGFWRSELGRL
jgi:hypothetical protein